MYLTKKRIASLTGTVVRLVTACKDDWHPVGVLKSVTEDNFHIHAHSKETPGKPWALDVPRKEIRSVEEVPVEPAEFLKYGREA